MTNRALPSGCAHAPRPATSPAWRCALARAMPWPLEQGGDVGGEGGQSEHARPALAGGLGGEPAGDARELTEAAGVLVEGQHHAGPERAAGRRDS